jgi:stage IV sporulation protein FB
MIFSEPPATRYDLRFTLAGIPVRVHPLFWLMTILIGGISGDVVFMLIWVVVVFLSILIHEMGHAIAMRIFSLPSRIVLYLMGGLTVPEAAPWMGRWATVSPEPREEVVISLAGPSAGFLFAGLVVLVVALAGGVVYLTPLFGIFPMPGAQLPAAGRVVNQVISALLWINVFWGFVNLVPVYPLDGGSVARHILVRLDPLEGYRRSLWLSVIAGAIAAIAGVILFGSFYIAFLFGALAFESYRQLQGRTGWPL